MPEQTEQIQVSEVVPHFAKNEEDYNETSIQV